MTDGGRAYATTSPDMVAAYRAARTAEKEFGSRTHRDAIALGRNTGFGASSVTGLGRRVVVGLIPDEPSDPPTGWSWSATRKCLVPKAGKAGGLARRWLIEHQPPAAANIHGILAGYGLPINDILGGDPGNTTLFTVPTVFFWDGTLWVHYRGTPGDWLVGRQRVDLAIWELQPLSRYHAAVEARVAARAHTESQESPPV